ncbi:MAG: aminotransferase class V-fold PLP-dependent enzyme [Planctomycetaceae bacterium]
MRPMNLDDPSADDLGQWRREWMLPTDVTYLNHGSFGPSPYQVHRTRKAWMDKLERQPMDFLIRQFEGHLDASLEQLAKFVGTKAHNLIWVDNATFAMNIVAASVKLEPDDEVLLTDHEYGAVQRIWRATCQKADARMVVQKMPVLLDATDEMIDALFAGVTDKTKLIVVSHVTSPTAVIFPVQDICRRAKKLGIRVCVDGPHALAMLPVNLGEIGCDYYCVSCHKWLCGPFGTGFLYVHPKWQNEMVSPIVSWGKSLGGNPPSWKDEFQWMGTRDPSAFLTVPTAIEFLEEFGLDRFRDHGHSLVQFAREEILKLSNNAPLTTDSPDWYGTMVSIPLPDSVQPTSKPGLLHPLQQKLWDDYKIEVLVTTFRERVYLRVSAYIYNTQEQMEYLVQAVKQSM